MCFKSLTIVIYMAAHIFCMALPSAWANLAEPETWQNPADWSVATAPGCNLEVEAPAAESENKFILRYELSPSGGWVSLQRALSDDFSIESPVVFSLRAVSADTMEIKFIDKDGSVFGRKVSLKAYRENTPMVFYLNNAEYWWGGDSEFNEFEKFEIAISGNGSGAIWFSEIGKGQAGSVSTFSLGGPMLDPNREKSGIGFEERRAEALTPEDPLILEWLKTIQDTASPEKRLLSSMEDNQAQTFNNSIAAMAFLLKGEKERAERILDFFSEATIEQNEDLALQNFFYKGEARGFYQYVVLNPEGATLAYHNPGVADRWIGDMAWLLIAYKHYEKMFGPERYGRISGLLKDLMISYYKEAGQCGYIQHGWREGDKRLHENHGHHEANIDCYAALRLCGEAELAEKVKVWLEGELKGDSLPLDLYTWRALAFDNASQEILNVPEYDLRFRKRLLVGDKEVMGFFHTADREVENIWIDGLGHMACAFFAVGNVQRGNFYANEMDKLIMDRVMGDKVVRAIPYTLNTTGGYNWVDTKKGFSSCAVWYLFAKARFNPMKLISTHNQ